MLANSNNNIWIRIFLKWFNRFTLEGSPLYYECFWRYWSTYVSYETVCVCVMRCRWYAAASVYEYDWPRGTLMFASVCVITIRFSNVSIRIHCALFDRIFENIANIDRTTQIGVCFAIALANKAISERPLGIYARVFICICYMCERVFACGVLFWRVSKHTVDRIYAELFVIFCIQT